jgi:hypothetical protein
MEVTFRPPLHALAVLALAGLMAMPAAAQWKWRDATGNVQYSDRPPPPGVQDKDVLSRPRGGQLAANKPAPVAMAPSAAASTSPLTGKMRDPELEARRQKAEKDDEARKKLAEEKQNAVRAENCQRARAHLKAIDDGMRLAQVNGKGEYEVMDDKQRAEEGKRTREMLNRDCGGK